MHSFLSSTISSAAKTNSITMPKSASSPSRPSSPSKLLQLQPPHKPLTSYSIFFRLERCYLYQKVLNIDNESALDLPPPSHRFDPDSHNFGVDMPPFPKRYRDVILPKDFHLHTAGEQWQGKRRKHRKTEGALSLAELSRLIAKNWRNADDEVTDYCDALSDVRKHIYMAELVVYEKRKTELMQKLGDTEEKNGSTSRKKSDSKKTEKASKAPAADVTGSSSVVLAPGSKSKSKSADSKCTAGARAAAASPARAAANPSNESSPPLAKPMCSFATAAPAPNVASTANNSATVPRQRSSSVGNERGPYDFVGQRNNNDQGPSMRMMHENNHPEFESREATLQKLQQIQLLRQMNFERSRDMENARLLYQQNATNGSSIPRDPHFAQQMALDRSKQQFHANLHESLQPGNHYGSPHDQSRALFQAKIAASASNGPFPHPRFMESNRGKSPSMSLPAALTAGRPSGTTVTPITSQKTSEAATTASAPRDTPSRFNIFCQLERQYVLQRELDSPPSVTSLGESGEQFDPVKEGFDRTVVLPRRYRGLLIPSKFYEKCPNHRLEEMMHIRFEMPSGIKCEYDISECIGRRWRVDVDRETLAFCDTVHRHLVSKSSSLSSAGASPAVGARNAAKRPVISEHRPESSNNNKRPRQEETRDDYREATLPLLLLRRGHSATTPISYDVQNITQENIYGGGSRESGSSYFSRHGHSSGSG